MLLLAIAWKIAIRPDARSHPEENLIKFFERNQFKVVVTDELVNYTRIIRATSASCQLQIARLTPDGSNRDLIRHFAAGLDRSFVVFAGKVYAQQPVPLTVLHYLWSRFLREVGLIERISPVINVAMNSSCDAERLPWGELGECTGKACAAGKPRDSAIRDLLWHDGDLRKLLQIERKQALLDLLGENGIELHTIFRAPHRRRTEDV